MKYATTDKLNDSMKAKVFKYRSDGNTVVAPYMVEKPLNFDPFGHARFAHLFVLYVDTN